MRIVLFSLFGINVYSHGVFLTLSFIIGGWLLFRWAKKENINTKHFLSNFVISVIFGIVISRVVYFLINISSYQNFSQITQIWQGGLVSFAGFIAGSLVYILLLRVQKQNILDWLNIIAIIFPLAIAIGRVGCVLNGEVGIKNYSAIAYYGYMPVTAMEIYLSMFIFTINISLYLFFRKKLIKYFLIFNFIALYSFFRIFIDSYRRDPKLFFGVNSSQLVALIILIISIIFFSFYLYQRKWRQNASG